MPSDRPSLTSFFTKVCGVVSTSTNGLVVVVLDAAPRGSRAPASSRRARCRRWRCSWRGCRRPGFWATAALISNWIAPSMLLALRRDVLELALELVLLDRADLDRELHAFLDLRDLGLVDAAVEDHVVHVGDRRDRGAGVEVVGLDHREAVLDRHVDHHAGGRRGDDQRRRLALARGSRPRGRAAGSSSRCRASCLRHRVVGAELLELGVGDDALLEQRLVALELALGVVERDLRACGRRDSAWLICIASGMIVILPSGSPFFTTLRRARRRAR